VVEETEDTVTLVAVVSGNDDWTSGVAEVLVVSEAEVEGLDVLADVTISVV
jgi:hypothetical protein